MSRRADRERPPAFAVRVDAACGGESDGGTRRQLRPGQEGTLLCYLLFKSPYSVCGFPIAAVLFARLLRIAPDW